MIVVVLPAHLRALAGVSGDVQLEINGEVTRRSILDALEARYPMLRGTIRDHVGGERRPLLRFFACGEDVTHEPAGNGAVLHHRCNRRRLIHNKEFYGNKYD